VNGLKKTYIMIESYCDSIKEDIAKLVEDRMDIHKEVRFK
jgi:hypothetical protein